MIPRNECYVKDEFGTSYTIGEAKLATEQRMDEYHKHLMSWLIYEVERLEGEKDKLREKLGRVKNDLESANYEIKCKWMDYT